MGVVRAKKDEMKKEKQSSSIMISWKRETVSVEAKQKRYIRLFTMHM